MDDGSHQRPRSDTSSTSAQAPWISPALVYAFGTAVTMWIAGFVTHIPGLEPPSQLTGILLIAFQLGGALLLGRVTASPVRAGALAGLGTALINILILGALIAPENPDDRPDRSAAVIILTYLAASSIGGAFTALVGARLLPKARRAGAHATHDWLGRFAVVTICSVVPVLLSGALVTSVEAGLAVRDWPGTYGALMWLYPLARMTGGIYYEHAHRLFGSLAGLTTLVLFFFALVAEPRRWTKILILGVFILVCAQGLLGGLRVTSAIPIEETPSTTIAAPQESVPLDYAQTRDTGTSRALAMFHGISAQITVAVLCIVAAVTGRRWRNTTVESRPPDAFLRTTSILLIVTLIIQLSLGAATRHFEHFHALMTHLAFATLVALAGAFAGFRTTKYGADMRPLALMGIHVFIFLGIQLLLGFLTMFAVLPTYKENAGPEPTSALVIATLHQAIGAALLSVSTVLLLWAHRLTSAHKGHGHHPVPVPQSE